MQAAKKKHGQSAPQKWQMEVNYVKTVQLKEELGKAGGIAGLEYRLQPPHLKTAVIFRNQIVIIGRKNSRFNVFFA